MGKKEFITPLTLLGMVVIAVVVISWFVFPDSHKTPGSTLVLIGAAIAGVVAVASGVVTYLNEWKKLTGKDEGEEDVKRGQGVTAGGDVNAGGDIAGHDVKKVDATTYIERQEIHHHYEPGKSKEGQTPKEQEVPMELPKPGELAEPGGLPRGSRMPFLRNAVFTGREEDLLELAEGLVYGPDGPQATGVGIVQATVATGMGGIGKTQVAVEFCYRYGRYFEGVHWLQANQDLMAEIAECGRMMGIEPWPEKAPEQVDATLRAWGQGERRLVVFDNLEEPRLLEEWLPMMNCVRALVTARREHWPRTLGIRTQRLGVLKRDESRTLLRKLAPRLEKRPDNELDELAERLGDLPLALHLAGSYLDSRPGLPIQGYLAELDKAGGMLKHAGLPESMADNPTKHDLSLAATFQVSWVKLDGEEAVDQAARRIFLASSYCAANAPIPVEVLARAVANGEEEEETERQFELGLRRLNECGLLAEEEGGPAVHPLLAEFGRAKDKAAEQSALPGLVKALCDLASTANKSGFPERYKPLRAHVQAAAETADRAGIAQAGKLWNEQGNHMNQVAEFIGAKAACERARAIDERAYGPDHTAVASDVNNLGMVLTNVGDLAGAKAAYERALAIDERAYGADHPTVARDVNNLGLVLKEQGDLVGAIAAYERALAIGERTYGTDHPTVAIYVNNQGLALQELGDLARAKAAYERALAIDERAYGPDHPTVARDVNNLGLVLKELGDLLGAIAAYERALAIDERAYGPDHPTVATDLNNLGLVLQDLGDMAGAKAAYERALAIIERVFGAERVRLWRRGERAGTKPAYERSMVRKLRD